MPLTGRAKQGPALSSVGFHGRRLSSKRACTITALIRRASSQGWAALPLQFFCSHQLGTTPPGDAGGERCRGLGALGGLCAHGQSRSGVDSSRTRLEVERDVSCPMALLELQRDQADTLPVIKQGGTVVFASGVMIQPASWNFFNRNGKCFPTTSTVWSVMFSVSWKASFAELSCFTFLLRMKVALLSEDWVVGMYQVIGKITLKLQMVWHTFIFVYLGAASVDLLPIYPFVRLMAWKHKLHS